MMRDWSWKAKLAAMAAFLWAAGSCAGGGCSGCDCMGRIPGGFSAQERIENAIQVRLTRAGLDFVEQNLGTILADQFPDGLEFDVPPSCDQDISGFGTIDFCGQGSADSCTPQDPACRIHVDVNSTSLEAVAPASLNVVVHMNVRTVNTFHTYGDQWYVPDCDIDFDTSQGSHPDVRVVATLDFIQDSVSGRLRLVLTNVEIPDGDIDDEDLDISGGVGCWLVNTFFKGTIINQLRSQVADQAASMMDSLCMACDLADPACPQLSSCQDVDGNAQCMEDSGEGCVQSLGTEGRVDLGAALASLAPALRAWMDLHTWAGGHSAAVNEGISQGVFGGASPWPEQAACVPAADPPQIQPVAWSSVFDANERPGGGSFHVGIGIHKSFLDAVGYSLYASGAMCLDMGPRQSDYLKVSTFSLMLPSLGDLIHDDDPGLVLAVRPQKPPVFELGAGTTDASGNILDPLITLDATDLAIDFYGLIDYRFIRLFRVVTDLALPVNLEVNDQNQLVPVLGELGDAFRNIRVEHSELLEESPEEIAAIFPALLDAAGNFMGDGLPPIDLPAMQGFRLVLEPGSITAVENGSFLAVFANLEYVGQQNRSLRVETRARIVATYVPDALRPTSVSEALQAGPWVELQVEPAAEEGPIEWSYRLDGGLWSPFVRNPRLRIARPALWIEGRHRIEVRARLVGRPETLDPSPAVLEFAVDRLPPEVTWYREGQRILVEAQDLVTPASRLEFSYHVPGRGWTAWSHETSVDLDTDPADAVRVRDEAGHVTQVGLYGRVEPRSSGSGCGCSSSPGPGQALWWLLFGVVFLLWRRLRRIRASLGAAVLLGFGVAGLASACGDDAPGNDTCEDASDVPLVCQEPVPECELWEDLVGLEEPTLDPDTCEPVPVPCECQVARTVRPGDFGRFLSLAASGGRVLVSCYSDTWGDLVVAERTADGSVIPEFVDGIPERAPVEADPNGYRRGILIPGPNVGKFSDIRFGSDGTARVVYVDVETGAVRFAQGTPGSWETSVVWEPPSEGARAWHTALLLGGDGRPLIFFAANGLVDDQDSNRRVGRLLLAEASSANPAGPADWNLEVVDETPIPCGGLCGSGQACLASDWTCHDVEDSCGECGQGTACVAGSCQEVAQAPTWTDHPEGTGLFVHGAFLPDGSLVVVYHDRTQGLLRAAVRRNGAWQAVTLDGDQYTDVGLYANLLVDGQGAVHVVYHDAVADALLHLVADADLNVQLREVVDDGLRDDGHHVVGLDPVLAADDAGRLHVFYQDGTDADLLHAVQQDDGTWQVSVQASGPAGYGFFTHLAQDTDGTWYLAQYVYDRSHEPLGFLSVEPIQF